ncbi:MAG TPA: LysR family transcriptional regulator [Luteibacter sp.]|jgi:DNA-binding transcriptional LysR family regulator|nr:LysR family transcriptional regulator [Luteibacter sp.]
MDDADVSWDLYRSFLAVVEEGSLSAAARSLGLTQPTIGRHVEALEGALGVALFTRSQNGLSPTDVAQNLVPYAQTLRATANALRRSATATRDDVSGTVRISASDVVGAEVLPGILAAARREYPRLDVELVASNRNQDLLQRHVDIAVRMAVPTQGALVARKVGTVALRLFARNDYLERHGMPKSVDELKSHSLIGFDRETAYIRAMQQRGLPLHRSMFALRTDSDLAQLGALRAGFGIGMCQVALARRDPRLVPVLSDAVSAGLETYVVMHEDMRASRRCRVMFDALFDGMATHIAAEAP